MDGQAVTPTKEGEWYVVTENVASLNIIFRNGTDWAGDPNQTIDMTFTSNTCIQLEQSGNAKATYTVIDCDKEETAVEDVEINQPQARKILYNGALYLIMPNGDIYNAAGVLVNK
jgi:hypothetical protein